MNINLKDKNALVCGSTKGIGYAIAMQLAECGANVTLMARNGELLKRIVRDLGQTPVQSMKNQLQDKIIHKP